MAALLGLDTEQVRVISPHVGGGFGSKVQPTADVVLAAMAARLVPGRPVKFALTRQQMFSLTGYRPPTLQRVRLGADADGRLTAVAHDVDRADLEAQRVRRAQHQSARPSMYAAPNRRTTQRVAALDVPTPTIMRAPGEATGMFALESAMDELAIACGLDPVELRIRNEPDVHPRVRPAVLQPEPGRVSARGRPPVRLGAARPRPPGPPGRPLAGRDRGGRRDVPGAPAARHHGDHPGRSGRPVRRADRPPSDIGTGTWTALTQIAADALRVDVEQVDLRHRRQPLPAGVGGGRIVGHHQLGRDDLRGGRSAARPVRR